MPAPMPTSLTDPGWNAFLAGGVSVVVAGRDGDGRPALMRAVGARFDAGMRRLTVYLSASRSVGLLRGIGDNGAIAVVISKPTTHQTVQLKGKDAALRPLDREDIERVDGYVRSMTQELAALGFPAAFVDALFDADPPSGIDARDLVAVGFTPAEAFVQTPGPRAGTALDGA